MPVKVSVIVPVYNVERYLEKCLRSLVEQTLSDIEIIVVNDGSPDNSQEIIDRFAEAYPEKITSLRQENKGLGAARNFGTAHAHGEYVGFVDSDDWVRQDMFELLFKTAEKEDADVVICDYYTVREGSSDHKPMKLWKDDADKLKTVSGFVRLSTSPALAWNKLYKRRLVRNTPFPGIYYEDIATIPVILSDCKKITYLPEPLYYYLLREGSIASQRNNPKNLNVIKAWERCLAESNPEFREETDYAVYVSVSFFLTSRKEHLDDFLLFFWKNEERFKGNKYIQDEIQRGKLVNLFEFMDTAGTGGNVSCEFTQNLLEFMEDTLPLVEQLDKLPQETLTELYDMYSIAVKSATENAAGVGPKLLVLLSARLERIREYIENDYNGN